MEAKSSCLLPSLFKCALFLYHARFFSQSLHRALSLAAKAHVHQKHSAFPLPSSCFARRWGRKCGAVQTPVSFSVPICGAVIARLHGNEARVVMRRRFARPCRIRRPCVLLLLVLLLETSLVRRRGKIREHLMTRRPDGLGSERRRNRDFPDRRSRLVLGRAEYVMIVGDEERDERPRDVQSRGENNSDCAMSAPAHHGQRTVQLTVPNRHFVDVVIVCNINQERRKSAQQVQVDGRQLVNQNIEGVDFLGPLIQLCDDGQLDDCNQGGAQTHQVL